ncbi:hypothetical protein BRARA_A03320 [Brassica rapa]|uniref:non-specific serine/threonine protein kinase n=1 Tax=Brassica campestris TaxID=3711 RepID=A0A398ASI7_BRACM|nr:hypothetical protein BRARA_A03320 [Brassica rapa]
MDLASKKSTSNDTTKEIDPTLIPKSPHAPFSLKLGDNVPRNPHFDLKKMDPLVRHQPSKSPEPPTATRGGTNEADSKHSEGDGLGTRKNPPKNLHYDPKKIVPLTTPETPSPSARTHPQRRTKSPDNKRAPRHNADSAYGDCPSATPFKPHTGGDVRWDAINSVTSRGPQIGLDSFRLLKPPEIIRGEGHGSAVDWWTFGIFLYELLHGTTPFKGPGNRDTLHNVVGRPLKFPDLPHVSSAARDLIRGLLVKDPHRRIAYTRGATEIKQHPFFEGVNWALVRSAAPPHIPDPVDLGPLTAARGKSKGHGGSDHYNNPMKPDAQVACAAGPATPTDDTAYVDFEYF